MKNKKMLKGCAIAAALFLGIGATTGTVFADTAGQAETTATVSFEGGELTLVSVPNFDFGSHVIPNTPTNYNATTTGKLAVSDLRGTGTGWSLTAALEKFQNGGDTLDGSVLTLGLPTVTTESGSTTATAPTSTSQVELTSDGAAFPIENAANGTGRGVWDTNWSSVSLSVAPEYVKTGTSTSQIDWILSDTP